MIKVKENEISVEEFNYLYDAVGWGHYENNITAKALANTLYSVSNRRCLKCALRGLRLPAYQKTNKNI